MKAMINGKEVEIRETVGMFFEELTFTDEEGINHFPCTLEVKVTHEGLILDLWHKDECVATFGATAQELADDFCH